MDLRPIRALEAIARHGNITRAAEELHIVQPALSQQLRRLEAEVGIALWDRAARELTEAGRVLLGRADLAERQLAAAREEIDQLRGLTRGSVRAGAIHWLRPFDLPGLLTGFHEAFPGIDVGLWEENADVMFEQLRSGELDIVFSNVSADDHVPPALAQRIVVREALVVGVAPTDPLARRKRISLTSLADRTLVAFRPGSAFRRTMDQALEIAGVAPRVAFESSDLITVRELAARGLGVAIIPRSLATAAGPPLQVLEISPRTLDRRVGLTWRSDGSPAPAARAFVEFTLDWIEPAESGR